MKLSALHLLAAACAALLSGCASDGSFDPVEARRWLDTTATVLDHYQSASAPPAPVPAFRTVQHQPTVAVPYAWSEEVAVPESWRQTLHHQGEVIEPAVVLNGKALK